MIRSIIVSSLMFQKKPCHENTPHELKILLSVVLKATPIGKKVFESSKKPETIATICGSFDGISTASTDFSESYTVT